MGSVSPKPLNVMLETAETRESTLTGASKASDVDSPTRHATLYFADGDLVIHAAEQDHVYGKLFRAHSFLLKQFSPVFRDMLSFPPTVAPGDFHDGAPLVRLYDSPVAVAQLLEVLYNPGYPIIDGQDPYLASNTYALMELATKYQVDSLRTRLAFELKQQWPPALVDHLERQRAPAAPEPASALRFAVRFDVPAVHAPACYALAVTPEHARDHTQWALLDADSLRCIERGRGALARIHHGLADELAARLECPRALEDQGRPPCAEVLCGAVNALSGCSISSMDPIMLLVAVVEQSRGCGLCKTCGQATRNVVLARMHELWDSVPVLFGLM